jgi:glycosyltransferase involved in cell wall biosynthesis
MGTNNGVLWVAVPAYNAEDTIEELIERIRGSLEYPKIIVVNDGSMDKTREKALSKGAVVLDHESNKGKGAALRTAFGHIAEKTDSGLIVTIDADLQHKPEEIPKLVEGLDRAGADLAIGSRRRLGTGMPLHRILSNTVTSFLMSLRTGIKIKDGQCGFRIFKIGVLKKIELESDGYEAETEFLIKVAKQGFKISFVPVETIYGNENSHMTNWKTTVNFVKVMLRRYR